VPRIATVVFRCGGKPYEFDAGELELVVGDRVVVATTRGADLGRLVKGPNEVPGDKAPRGLKRIVRKATPADTGSSSRIARPSARPSALVAPSSPSWGST